MKRVIPARPDLKRAAVRLADQITTAREDLRRALIDAGDTRAARCRLQELEREAAAVSQELAELNAAASDEAQRQLQVRAEELAASAAERLETQLAALQPPPTPEAC